MYNWIINCLMIHIPLNHQAVFRPAGDWQGLKTVSDSYVLKAGNVWTFVFKHSEALTWVL